MLHNSQVHSGILALCATLFSLQHRRSKKAVQAPSSYVPRKLAPSIVFQSQRVNLDLVFSSKAKRKRDVDVVIIGPCGGKLSEQETGLSKKETDAGGVIVSFLPKLLGDYRVRNLLCPCYIGPSPATTLPDHSFSRSKTHRMFHFSHSRYPTHSPLFYPPIQIARS